MGQDGREKIKTCEIRVIYFHASINQSINKYIIFNDDMHYKSYNIRIIVICITNNEHAESMK